MKAIGYVDGKTLDDDDVFITLEQEIPEVTGFDILVAVQAISVNPVDCKIRMTNSQTQPRVLGWDAAGIVHAVGDKTSLFEVGDAVYYAGDITRSGSNAQLQLVDERIVAKQPKRLDIAESAALPLTAITAWEALFDRMQIKVDADSNKSILIIGAAGGVGSMAIQLAKHAGLKVIATASRIKSCAWCRSLGADILINHHDGLKQAFNEKQLDAPDYVLCLQQPDQYFDDILALIKPQGTLCNLLDLQQEHDMRPVRTKSLTLTWEFMFTRSMYQTSDMIKQHQLLNQLAILIDQGTIRSTLKQVLGYLTPENLKKAHRLIETNECVGKLVLLLEDYKPKKHNLTDIKP